MMMNLILRLDVVKDLDRLVNRSGLYHDFLEPPVESAIFFNKLTVLVKRGCSNTLQFTTGKRRLENIACIKRTRGAASADNGVQFINEQNHIT